QDRTCLIVRYRSDERIETPLLPSDGQSKEVKLVVGFTGRQDKLRRPVTQRHALGVLPLSLTVEASDEDYALGAFSQSVRSDRVLAAEHLCVLGLRGRVSLGQREAVDAHPALRKNGAAKEACGQCAAEPGVPRLSEGVRIHLSPNDTRIQRARRF